MTTGYQFAGIVDTTYEGKFILAARSAVRRLILNEQTQENLNLRSAVRID